MKKTRTNLVLVLLVAVIFFGLANANPNALPHSILTALQGIQEAILALSEPEQEVEDNMEGYCKYLEIVANSNQVVFTVPAGEQFVLRKLISGYPERLSLINWNLSVNDEIFIDGIINRSSCQVGPNGIVVYKLEHNFPDKCVTINAGEILKIINEEEGFVLKTTIIGYFQDIQDENE